MCDMPYISDIFYSAILTLVWASKAESSSFTTTRIDGSISLSSLDVVSGGLNISAPNPSWPKGTTPGISWSLVRGVLGTAVGVMAGFCQAGGVGKTLAEWMIE